MCAKRPTKNRTIDQRTAICSECSETGNVTSGSNSGASNPGISDDTALSDIPFGELKNWLQDELRTNIKQIVKQELDSIKKNVSEIKSQVDKNTQSVSGNSAKIDALEGKVNTLQNGCTEVTAMSKNNLKYLVNIDRNERRQNVIIFGAPEIDLTIGNVTSRSDPDKFAALAQVMNLGETCRNAVKEIFRLGNIDEGDVERRRPMKVRFTSSGPATEVIQAGKKLKDLPDQNIYVKPDKTKGEQEEFKRIGKRKSDLLTEYNNDNEKVKLTKGVLYVDGVEVDRYKSPQTLF